MSPLLEQFLSEARDFLQGIGEKLMQLEKVAPLTTDLMTELFRYVHTLKGNSGSLRLSGDDPGAARRRRSDGCRAQGQVAVFAGTCRPPARCHGFRRHAVRRG
jgi:hypothetical protein